MLVPWDRLAEYKKEASLAVTIAVVGVLAMAFVSAYLFPASSGGSPMLTSNAPKPPARGLGTSFGTTSTSTTSPSFMFTTTCFTSGSPTTTAQGWGPGDLINATLNSPEVQSYIKTAYSYDIIQESASTSDPNLAVVIINVTGSQTVTGNWTSGYFVSYTGIRTLNVTVQFTAPSTFSVAAVSAASFPSRNESITYTSQQQQVIGVALSNDTVQSYMASYGVSPFYVEAVTTFPIANGTYGGDYFALISQVNGPRFMGVFVNTGITAVVNVYEDSTTMYFCYSSTACFTSPWDFTP